MTNWGNAVVYGVCLLMIACGSKASTHSVAAPPNGHINEPIALAVTGSFTSDDRFLWTANGGRFDGPTNGPTVTFVPTTTGPATALVAIKFGDGTSTVVQATISIDDAAAASGRGPSPAQSATATVSPIAQQSTSGTAPSPVDIEAAGFIPSGWMGDGEKQGYVQLTQRALEQPHSAPASDRLDYKPGPVGWAAIAWQFPENNWGDRPGRNMSQGFRRISIWARAEEHNGLFPKVQFKAGGATNPTKRYQASFEIVGDFVTLTREWKQYFLEIPPGTDLSNVASALIIVIRAQDVDPQGARVYVDDITYQ